MHAINEYKFGRDSNFNKVRSNYHKTRTKSNKTRVWRAMAVFDPKRPDSKINATLLQVSVRWVTVLSPTGWVSLFEGYPLFRTALIFMKVDLLMGCILSSTNHLTI